MKVKSQAANSQATGMQVHTQHHCRKLRSSCCISTRQLHRDSVGHVSSTLLPCKQQPKRRGRVCLHASAAEAVEALVSDYMGCLREYRAMQKALGVKAAQQARELSSLMHELGKEEIVIQAAQKAGVDVKQLSGLIAMRRRLLNDLPVIKARVTEGMNAQHPGNCNTDGGTPAPLATRQWTHAKQYRQSMKKEAQQLQQHSHVADSQQAENHGSRQQPTNSGMHLTPQSANGKTFSPAVPGSSWIQRLGFSDMVQHSHDAVNTPTSNASLHLMPGTACDSTSTQSAMSQAVQALGHQSVDSSMIHRAPQSSDGQHIGVSVPSCASDHTPCSSITSQGSGSVNEGHGNSIHSSQPQENQPVVTIPTASTQQQSYSPTAVTDIGISSKSVRESVLAIEQASDSQQVASAHSTLNTTSALDTSHTSGLSNCSSDGSQQPQNTNTQQARVESASEANEDQATVEVPYGAPARLQSALLSALKYKKQKQVPAQKSGERGAEVEVKTPETPPEFAGLTLQQTVERAKFDVQSFTRNSRANAEEAALLICP